MIYLFFYDELIRIKANIYFNDELSNDKKITFLIFDMYKMLV